MWFWLDYNGIPGITTREKNDEVKKAATLAALPHAVESIPAYAERSSLGRTIVTETTECVCVSRK